MSGISITRLGFGFVCILPIKIVMYLAYRIANANNTVFEIEKKIENNNIESHTFISRTRNANYDSKPIFKQNYYSQNTVDLNQKILLEKRANFISKNVKYKAKNILKLFKKVKQANNMFVYKNYRFTLEESDRRNNCFILKEYRNNKIYRESLFDNNELIQISELISNDGINKRQNKCIGNFSEDKFILKQVCIDNKESANGFNQNEEVYIYDEISGKVKKYYGKNLSVAFA